jgi:hypothetical protein
LGPRITENRLIYIYIYTHTHIHTHAHTYITEGRTALAETSVVWVSALLKERTKERGGKEEIWRGVCEFAGAGGGYY